MQGRKREMTDGIVKSVFKVAGEFGRGYNKGNFRLLGEE